MLDVGHHALVVHVMESMEGKWHQTDRMEIEEAGGIAIDDVLEKHLLKVSNDWSRKSC